MNQCTLADVIIVTEVPVLVVVMVEQVTVVVVPGNMVGLLVTVFVVAVIIVSVRQLGEAEVAQ